MPKLVDLFSVINGIGTTGLDIVEDADSEHTLPMLRPSNSFQKLLSGFVNPWSIPKSKIFTKDSLVVSTNGEGSHTYSYVVPYQFTANSDVSILVPKKTMTLKTKLFFSLAVTQSRWRYSYGRKPKGIRLENLELPPLPAWAESLNIPDFQKQITKSIPSKKINKWTEIGEFETVGKLFEIRSGSNYELNHMIPDQNGIAFVSRTKRNNGISGRVAHTGEEPAPAGCLTVALGGSVLETFYQEEPTYQGWHVAVLIPRTKMTFDEKMWYATAIRQHQFRFNYGRQANRQLPDLQIPKFPKLKREQG